MIDFTNSISDNNEKTYSKNFFAFSTGDIIDTKSRSPIDSRESRTDARHYDRPAQQFGRFCIRETPVRPYFPYE